MQPAAKHREGPSDWLKLRPAAAALTSLRRCSPGHARAPPPLPAHACVHVQASNKEVLGAYAKFYNLLLTAGYDTWQDYVLDQVRGPPRPYGAYAGLGLGGTGMHGLGHGCT